MDAKEVKKTPETEPIKMAEIPLKSHRRDIHMAVMVCGAAFLVLLGVGIGAVVYRTHAAMRAQTAGGVVREHGMITRQEPRIMADDVNPTDGKTISHLSGVVTQVSSDSFVIAGNGTTKTIKTTSTTSYGAATKVTVNDTIVASGTDDNGTFTATNVRILNAQ